MYNVDLKLQIDHGTIGAVKIQEKWNFKQTVVPIMLPFCDLEIS